MKHRKRINKTAALFLILALLLGTVSTSENSAGGSGTYYSDWLSMDDIPEARDSRGSPSGARDLGAFLQEASLLSADGTLLSDDDVWPVTPGGVYQVRLRFGETAGNGSLQFSADNNPLVYQLPDGLSAGDENLTLPLRVELGGGETAEAVCTYDAAARTLSVEWDPGLSGRILSTESAGFEVIIPAVISDVDVLAFNDQLVVSLLRARSRTRSSTQTSSNLADFLYDLTITGAELKDGKYVILEDVPYEIVMSFSEQTNLKQFNHDAEALTYQFPFGFTPLPEEGDVEMEGPAGAGVVRFHYEIRGDMLYVTFDRESPGYQTFITSETAGFTIRAEGVISKEQIAFSDEVMGEFNIDDTREVTVEKVGEYDPVLNKIKFTIQAHSRGNNTNIHIGDIITGEALSYDSSSLTVSSNVSGDSVSYTLDNPPRDGETFGLTIPSMVHGETVTVEYYTDVDLSGLTPGPDGSYHGEKTGNSVRIWSDEDHEGDKEDIKHKISLSTNSKTHSAPTVHDGKTYVTWTIVLNENANISIAGSAVTDTIEGSSRPYMSYSGYGLHIEKYEKGGTLVGTDNIQWGTNGLNMLEDGKSWKYTIPASDEGHNYKYVITYETEVDSDVLLKPTHVSNTVHNEYDTDHDGEDIESTGEEVEAEKTAVHSNIDPTNKKAETLWEITFTVPSAGLDSAQIIDSLPRILNPVENIWYYDTLKEGSGSVYVGEGDLLKGEGESFLVRQDEQTHQVIITFTKNNGEPGLKGTGLPRTIHVYLTTTANHDWLVFAESPLSEPRFRTHENNAVVRLNSQDLNVTASTSYNTSKYVIEKNKEGTYSTNTDPSLPIYVYRIILTNVNDDAFDSEGYLTITDQYDASYLVFKPTYETGYSWEVNRVNGHVFGNPQSSKDDLLDFRKGPYVVESATPEGKIVFKLSKDDLPKNGESYYYYYTIAYALQVKDAETLARMKEEALHNDGLKVDLVNTAGNDLFGTAELVTEYTVHVLEKSLESEEDNSITGTHDLHFTIDVNPDSLRIGDEDMITLKDTVSNLSFDYTSIEIVRPVDDDQNLPLLEGDTVNRVGNSIIFTLHNETHYKITYTTRLIGFHDVHWNNKAVLYGRVAGESGTSSSESGGSGWYNLFGMNVKKYAEGNMNKGLEATFELYEARVKDQNGIDIPESEQDWNKVAEFTTDGTTGLAHISTVHPDGENERSLRPYSYHDTEGNVKFDGGSLGPEAYGWRYRVREIVAPPGYQKTDEVYEFGISDIPSYTAPYNYLNNDTVTIVNKPVPAPVEIMITGKKVLVGKELEDQEFTFSLSPEESVRTVWGEGYPGGFDGSLTAGNDADGHFRFALSFTYDDYLQAAEKGFVDAGRSAYFYYVVRENLPEGAEDNFWNGVVYDASQFLVRVRLSCVEGDLITVTEYYPYDGNGIPEDLLVRSQTI